MVLGEPGIRIEPSGTTTTRSGWRFVVAPPAGWRWAPTTCLACRLTALRIPLANGANCKSHTILQVCSLNYGCRLNRVVDFVVPYWVVVQVSSLLVDALFIGGFCRSG
jgi:hypothetical protein